MKTWIENVTIKTQSISRMNRFISLIVIYFLLSNCQAFSQTDTIKSTMQSPTVKKWYDSFSIRGYAQLR
jgi:hypothetical protein